MANDTSQTIKDDKGNDIGAVDAHAFAQDPLGDRGWLRYPYQAGALIFQYDTALNTWVIVRDNIVFSDSGLGDEDVRTGFTGAQTETDTSLFPGGYFGTSAYGTVRGFGVSLSTLPYGGAASILTADEAVPRASGTTAPGRIDCVGIAGLLLQSALQNSDFEFSQNGRTCQSLLGPGEQNPSGFGIASQEDTTNGALNGCMARIAMRRPIVTPPASSNAIGYVWEQHFQQKVGVPFDPSFAEPTDNDICILKERCTWDMYFSDKNGLPLVMTGAMADFYEQNIANGAAY